MSQGQLEWPDRQHDQRGEILMMVTERALGRSGLATTPLMLGGNVFGWTADRDASFAIFDAFIDGGGKLIDTADMCSNWIPGLVGGESDTIIGEWQASRGCRDRVLIATKVHPVGDISLCR